MIEKKSAFMTHQRDILRLLRRSGALGAGRLARKGSRVQELVERLRLLPAERLIHPITIRGHGYPPTIVQQALARMIIVGELEQVRHGVYRLIQAEE